MGGVYAINRKHKLLKLHRGASIALKTSFFAVRKCGLTLDPPQEIKGGRRLQTNDNLVLLACN